MTAKTILLLLFLTLTVTSCRREQRPSEEPQTLLRQTQPIAGTANQNQQAAQQDRDSLLNQRTARGMASKILYRKGYVTSYNHETRTPNWVAWTLTKQHTYGDNQRSEERFEEDTDVKTPRATYADYYNSRYDRGHMCPAGDNKWDAQAMTESFLMTNVCPQNHGLNKEDWNDLEIQCRSWARRYGEIVIVCGPIFDNDNQPRFIGRNRVRVPDSFYKVVYRRSPRPTVLAVIMENHGRPQPWQQHVTTVDNVERLTGLDLLPALPDDIEVRLEAEKNMEDWEM